MVKLIGIGLAVGGAIIGVVAMAGFGHIPITIFGGLLFIIGAIALIKG